MKLEDEMAAFPQARIEQSDQWNAFHERGSMDAKDLQAMMAVAIAAQREAILRLARAIDELAEN